MFTVTSVAVSQPDASTPSSCFVDLQGYAPLLQDWENFYTRRLYHRIQDAWNRPIAGPPTASRMKVVERISHDGNRTLV